MVRDALSVTEVEVFMLQPIATILASLVVVGVTGYFGWHQREIAREQARIAREKLRLDLYDRRFEIFTSIFDFYDAMISWKGTREQEKARIRRSGNADGQDEHSDREFERTVHDRPSPWTRSSPNRFMDGSWSSETAHNCRGLLPQ
jgi:hypothetical protein